MKYRSPGPLAYALSLAVLANLGLPLVLDGLERRQARVLSVVVAGVLTLFFVHRAARNLDAIGDGQARFTPGQCVGWLLIPAVNLWMAHQVLAALWRDSQPSPRKLHLGNADFSVHAVNAWLAITVFGFVLSMSDWRLGWTLAGALRLAQGVTYIVIVLGIAHRQREQWIDLERRGSVPLPTANTLR